MKTVYKKNNELKYDEVEKLYNLFEENMKKVSDGTFYIHTFNDVYKKKWIDETLNDDNLIALIFYNDEDIAGFLFILLLESENFIREFQISPKYQGDGSTFYSMICTAVPYLDKTKELCGDIWMVNKKSQEVFRHLGARVNADGKYHLDIDTLASWIASKKN